MFFTAVSLVSCDKDFNEVGTGIIGEDHYDFAKIDSSYLAVASHPTGPVQSDGLGVNAFGVYNNPVYGRTTANFVTQVSLSALAPTIEGTVDIKEAKLYIPYYATLEDTETNGTHTYSLDSIYGSQETLFNLKIFENGYFLRSQTHTDGEVEAQPYYNNMNSEINAAKGPQLNTSSMPEQNTAFKFSNAEHRVIEEPEDEDDEPDTSYVAPGMRVDLNLDYIRTKIFETASSNLAGQNLFRNHFRGLYFQIENNQPASTGALNMMNFAGGSIAIKYTTTVIGDHDNDDTTPDEPITTDRTITINLAGTSISLLNYENVPTVPADKIAVKGGQGYVTTLDVFNAQQINRMRDEKWMINEANLIFFVDRETMSPSDVPPATWAPEPKRLYLYDAQNGQNIADYLFDNTTGSTEKDYKGIYGGSLITDDKLSSTYLNDLGITPNSTYPRGVFYKIRVTNYLRTLLQNADSTNVKLGLSVTEIITEDAMHKLSTPFVTSAGNITIDEIPKGSAMNPLGTFLYGPNYADEKKRLKLVVYYTKPDEEN